MIAILSRTLGFFDDRANPILVKEIRQGTRSKMFLVFFTLLLLGAVAFAVFGPAALAAEVRGQRAGLDMFNCFLACLAVAALGAVPWMSFRALVAEREQDTYELLAVSGMSAWRIVSGKLNSAMLQLLMFFSAITPFMAFSFLLRGVDMVSMLIPIAWLLGAAILATMAAVWLGTLVTSSRFMFIGHLLLIGGLFGLIYGALAAIFGGELVRVLPQLRQEPWFWWANLGGATVAGGTFALLFTLTAANLMFESANRSTGPRIAFLAWCVSILALFLIVWRLDDMRSSELWAVVAGILTVPAYLAGLFAVTEPLGLSRRMRPKITRNPFKHLWAMFFYPGAGRGWNYFLLICLLTGGVPALLCHVGWRIEAATVAPAAQYHGRETLYHVPLWLMFTNLIYLGLFSVILRLVWRSVVRKASLYRTTVMMMSVLAMLLPMLVMAVVTAGSNRDFNDYKFLAITNVVWAIGDQLWKDPTRSGPILTTLAALAAGAVLLNVGLIVHDLAEQARVAKENRIAAELRRSAGSPSPS